MYEFFIERKVEKKLQKYILARNDIKEKLDRLKENPHKANGAHPLKGKLLGKWACWLGSNIRLIYSIDSKNKKIFVEAVGSHKIY